MGFYKNIDAALQDINDDELREFVEWDRAHRDSMSAEARWAIMTDEVLMDAAIRVWRKDGARKPASGHVALQGSRRDLRVKKSHTSLLGWTLTGVALVTGVTVVVVSL